MVIDRTRQGLGGIAGAQGLFRDDYPRPISSLPAEDRTIPFVDVTVDYLAIGIGLDQDRTEDIGMNISNRPRACSRRKTQTKMLMA